MSFGFKNIGHFFAVVARDIVKVGTVVQSTEAPVEAITAAIGLVVPAALPALAIERAAYAGGGYVVQAAKDFNVPDDADPNATINLTFPMLVSEVKDFEAMYAAFEAMAHKAGVAPAAA